MSYYYNYYIGYRKDGKYYPWGPYDANGKLSPAVWKSRSFASDLHDRFFLIEEKEISNELRTEFEYEDWTGEKSVEVRCLAAKDLPDGSFIKTGYFLIEDVVQYEKYHDSFDLFYKSLPPQVYVAKMDHELKFGPNKPKKDELGEEYTEPNASDYMYYAYPDYDSEEYEAYILRHYVNNLEDYSLLKDGVEWVILETEG